MFQLPNIPLWYVIQTKPNQEDRTNSNLAALGIETYLPKICKWNKFNVIKKTTDELKPLFPRYIFGRFNALKMFQKVRFTRGVSNIVGFGLQPCTVDDEIIGIIKSRCNEDGFVSVEKKFEPGDMVIVNKPYLEEFTGIFKKELNDRQRVSILLTAVNYQAHIIVEKKDVEKINSTNH